MIDVLSITVRMNNVTWIDLLSQAHHSSTDWSILYIRNHKLTVKGKSIYEENQHGIYINHNAEIEGMATPNSNYEINSWN